MTIWNITLNDLKITLKDKMFFFWLLVFPLLFAFLFGLAFPSSSGSDQKVQISIVDKDESFLSKALIDELKNEKYNIQVLHDEKDINVRALIIPENFSQNILERKKVELVLRKEEGSNMKASQAAYSHVLKAIIKIISRLVILSPQNESDLQEKFNQQTLERLISLRSELVGRIKIIPGGFNHMIPATSVMFIMFTVLMYGGINLLEERRLGQLERIFLSPATFSSIVVGKWVSRLILGLLQIILLFLVGKILFKTYLGESILGLFLVALFLCGTASGMSVFLGSIIRKEEILIVLNILLANLLAGLGGCWIPMELFPSGLKKISSMLPTGSALDAFDKLIFYAYDLKSILLNISILFAYTLVFLLLAIKFFKLRKS